MIAPVEESAAAAAWAVGAAVVSAVVALWALFVARGANERADRAIEEAKTANNLAAHGNTIAGEANRHSEEAVREARGANGIAQRALDEQIAEARVALRVETTLSASEYHPTRLRARVRITNLSRFPVWIASIEWIGSSPRLWAGMGYEIASDAFRLPGELPARATMDRQTIEIDSGDPTLFEIKECYVNTQCGERVAGLSEQWKQFVFDLAVKSGKPVPRYPQPEPRS